MSTNEYQGGFCDVCGKEFANMAQHLKTKKHLTAVARLAKKDEVITSPEPIVIPEIDKETELKTLLKKVAPSIYANEQPPEDIAPLEEEQIEEIIPDEGGISIWFVLAIPVLIIIAFAAFIMTRSNDA